LRPQELAVPSLSIIGIAVRCTNVAAKSERTARLEARISPETLAIIRRAAEIQNRSVSEFVAAAAAGGCTAGDSSSRATEPDPQTTAESSIGTRVQAPSCFDQAKVMFVRGRRTDTNPRMISRCVRGFVSPLEQAGDVAGAALIATHSSATSLLQRPNQQAPVVLSCTLLRQSFVARQPGHRHSECLQLQREPVIGHAERFVVAATLMIL
jgi:hypothetical protein